MAWVNIATRDTDDANSATDVNQLMENNRILGGNGVSAPSNDIETLETEMNTAQADILLRPIDSDNMIINGGMDINQRAASYTAIASGTYLLDRWIYNRAGGGRHTATQDSSVVPNTATGFSLKLDVTTADGTIAAGDLYVVGQYVEGYNFRKLNGKACILSFNVRSPLDGIHCVSFISSGSDRSYIVEYTVDTADTWQLVQIPITFDGGGSGTWDYINGIGIRVFFTLAAGANFQDSADTWLSTQEYATSNQVNTLNNGANNFYLANVKLQLAPYTIFNNRPFQQELSFCQRYYEHNYDYGVYPGAATQVGAQEFYTSGNNNSDHNIRLDPRYKVSKGSTPTISTYDVAGNGGSGGAARVTMVAGNNKAATIANVGFTGFRVNGANGAVSTERKIQVFYEADSEL